MIVSFAWPSTYHRTGGVVVMYRFANGLARRGHEVHFIHGPAWPDRIESVDEVEWFEFDDRIQHHIVDSLSDPSLPSGDVIFSAGAQPRQGLPCQFIQGARMMSEDIERGAYRLRGPKVCVSRWLMGVGLRYGVPEEQLWHVPLGLDHDLFRVHTPADRRRYDVAITYHVHPTKGWNVGLRALHELRSVRPDLRVAVFGGGGIPDRVEDWMDFYEYPHHEVLVEEVYNASRVFLQPSNLEGFGFTCIEAMACGAALVTTDNGGSDEYARDGETALVVPPGDASGLAAAIGSLLDDAPRRAAIVLAGERFVRRFDWEVGTDVLEKHLLAYVDEPARFQQAPAAWGENAGDLVKSPDDDELVFNIVWTGTVFTYLRFFVVSQIAQSRARFRFVVNGCPPEQVALMHDFADRHADRVVEVLDVSNSETIIAHGVALDRVRAQRDDGPWFCFIDPDIKANAVFVPEFATLLGAGNAAVTSGKEVWSDDNFIPVDHPGVAGEFFFDRAGFVFGSPHLALYDRAVLDETTRRWRIGLGSAGPEISDEAKARMAELGHEYLVYDTAKIVNALLQADGHTLVHRDLPQLIHIGGLSHYLSPPGGYITLDDGEVAPDFARWGITDRYHVTKFTALTLRELAEGRAAPPVPAGVEPAMAAKLEIVQREMADLLGAPRPLVIRL